MAIDPSFGAQARFPGLRPEVLAGYLDAPEHVVAEVVDGELFLLPRPRPQHAHASSRLGRRLGPFSDPIGDEPGGWVIFNEPELHLGARPDIIDPDLAGWRRERMPRLPDEAAIVLPPDWVCEVLSDRTEALDRGRKMRIFRREGVGHVWLVSPELRTVEVYRLENGRYSLLDTFEGEQVVRAEPFELVELPLGALWSL
ncbi:MAG: Uma2 family endonuclease [Polyangiaceae bacterium]|jgi:Uma2 family endonuclease|nr:Uma2 family endonuclease [Polyangiaceae bacterium]